jgi:O-antigen/teichoic acid export membrane protein
LLKKIRHFLIEDVSRTWQVHLAFRYTMMAAMGVGLSQAGFSRIFIGQFEALLLLGSLLSVFWVNGSFQTWISLGNSIERAQRAVALHMFCWGAGLALILWVWPEPFLRLTRIQETLNGQSVIPWVALWLVTYPFSLLMEFSWMVKGRVKAIWISTLFLQPVLPILTLLAALYFNHPVQVFMVLAVWGLLRLILFLGLEWRVLFSSDFTGSGKFARNALPLMGAALLAASGPQVDGILVRHFFDDADFALFVYGAREFPLTVLLAAALSESMVLNYRSTGSLQVLKQKSASLILPLFSISCLLLFFSESLFSFFFTETFRTAHKVFDIYLLLIVPRLLFPQVIPLANGRRNLLFSITLTEFLLNIGLSIAFAPVFGLQGVAWATFIAYSFDKVVLALYNLKNGVPISEWLALKPWALSSVVLIFLFLIKQYWV